MVYGNLMNKLLSSIGMPVDSIPYFLSHER